MPERGYFLKLSGAFLLGLITLAAAVISAVLLLPIIGPVIIAVLPFLGAAAMAFALLIIAVLIIWAIIYFCAMLGIFIIYWFRPMQVSDKPGSYNVDDVKESGKRQKGDSEKKEQKEEE